MNKNTILVVMPIYNAEATLANAIESLLNQTYRNIELVLVDDCSTDSSLSIAEHYAKQDNRVQVIKNSYNKGAYYSRNIGLYVNRNKSWGYFSTHDADDVSFPFRFKLAIQHLKNSTVTGVQDTFDRKNIKTGKILESSLTIAHAIFKREIFEKVGYFEVKRFGADWEHWARVGLYNKQHGYTTRAISQVVGDSFISDSNLTVQIPIGSKPREDYIAASRKRHQKILNVPNGLYQDFNSKMSPPPDHGQKIIHRDGPKRGTKRRALSKTKQNKYKDTKVTIVLLTWQRISNLKRTLQMLSSQTFTNFDIRISNANLKAIKQVDNYAKAFSDNLSISVSHDGNDQFAFRRFTLGKELAKNGTDIILFLDDDITIGSDYVEHTLRHYEPKSYKSGFCWHFTDKGADYYGKRFRVRKYNTKIHYAGTGVSIIDAKAFLNQKLFDNMPEEAYKIEDLWLSYCIDHRLKWKLGYIEMNNASIGGADSVALYKKIISDKKSGKAPDKADFLRKLIKEYGWRL